MSTEKWKWHKAVDGTNGENEYNALESEYGETVLTYIHTYTPDQEPQTCVVVRDAHAAALIEAAPDLLAVAEMLLRWDERKWQGLMSNALEIARDAVERVNATLPKRVG